MILGNKQFNRSPVPSQAFIWVADYYDNQHLAEFDFGSKKANSFYEINKEKIVRFGLIGHGSQIYFDIANGIFNFDNKRYMISYITKTKEYPLTGRTFLYNDIITFKNAVADANLFAKQSCSGQFNHTITNFNLGYKKKMLLEDVNINFQNILTIPLDEPIYFQIKISADKDLDGDLIIRKDGQIVEVINAPLHKNMTGIINWEIK